MPSLKISSGPYGSHSARAPFDPRFEETSPIASLVAEGEKIGNIKDADVQEEPTKRPIFPKDTTWIYSELEKDMIRIFEKDDEDEG